MAEQPPRPAPEPDPGETGSWLVEELAAPGGEERAPPAEDEDWGGLAVEDEERAEPDEALEDDEAFEDDDAFADDEIFEDDDGLADAVADLRRDLARVTMELDRLAGAFASRMDGLEERLRALASDAAATQETLAVVARYRRHEPSAAEPEAKGLDLNAASFEDLRRIGLSATQATRVLTYRDGIGGFDAVDRLREVPGLPDALVERIAPQTRV